MIFFFLIRTFLLNERNFIFNSIPNILEHIYIRYRNKIIRLIKNIIDQNFCKISGCGAVLQMDETAISRIGNINNPTATNDDAQNTTWFFRGGGVIGGLDKKFFLFCS